jgi:hypothetical protein
MVGGELVCCEIRRGKPASAALVVGASVVDTVAVGQDGAVGDGGVVGTGDAVTNSVAVGVQVAAGRGVLFAHPANAAKRSKVAIVGFAQSLPPSPATQDRSRGFTRFAMCRYQLICLRPIPLASENIPSEDSAIGLTRISALIAVQLTAPCTGA